MTEAQKSQRRWTKAEEKLLGTKPDAEVASILGRSQFAVQIRRHFLGIPARYENRSAWTPQRTDGPILYWEGKRNRNEMQESKVMIPRSDP